MLVKALKGAALCFWLLAAFWSGCLGATQRQRRSFGSGRSNKEPESINSVRTPPSATFLTKNYTVILAQSGGTAKLPCVVRKSTNAIVTWIRKNDSPTLLTVGPDTYSVDNRFLVEHTRHLQNWGLLIKHVRPTDAGLYECQVATHPPVCILVDLKVTEASAEIIGAPDLHVRAGSTLEVTCALRRSTEPPSYVFWYRETHMVNHDAGVSVTNGDSESVLRLEGVDKKHEGNYTCYPENARQAHVYVHVLNSTEEEYPAAMLHVNTATTVQRGYYIKIFLLIFILEYCEYKR